MGLDLVEFVMEVERTFDVDIPNGDAARIQTPRDLVDWLVRHRKPSRAGACPSQRTFYRLRRAVQQVVDVPREQLRPSTFWEAILPLENRTRPWRRIQRVGALRLPALELSRTARRCIAIGAVLSAVLLFLVLWWLFDVRWALLAASSFALVQLLVLSSLANVFARRIPSSYESLGDAARFAYAMDWRLGGKRGIEGSRKEIRAVVRSLVTEHFDVTGFSDDANFIKDLHAD